MRSNKVPRFRTRLTRLNKITAAIVAFVVVGGGYIVLHIMAASNFASLEAEAGSRLSKASRITDVRASGSEALQFGSGQQVPDPEPSDTFTKQQVIDQAGPRYSFTQTMTSSQAKEIIVDTGLLERAKVIGMLNLSDVDRAYIIRDVEVDANGGLYGIRTKVGYAGVTSPTGDQLIEYVDVHGATSAGLYVRDVIIRHANVWGNIDNIKSADRVEVYASWIHDQSWQSGCHCDAVQIQYGVDQYYHWNIIDAHYGDVNIAGERAGSLSNGALQTGGMIGDASVRFHDNWWNGGQYTVRMGNSGPPTIDYQFRRNKHGRDFNFGPLSGSTSQPTSYGGIRFDSSNVWEDTGLPLSG